MESKDIKLALYDKSWWEHFTQQDRTGGVHVRLQVGPNNEMFIIDSSGFIVPPSVIDKIIAALKLGSSLIDEETVLNENVGKVS